MKENLDNVLNAHSDVVRIERLTHHIQRIREDQHAMRAAIERMSEAVTRLALVEERQAAASAAIERLVQSLERLDERLRRLEVAEPVPASCTRRQGRLALLQAGKLDDVESTIAAITDSLQRRAAQIEYEADTWERSNMFLQGMWNQLGGTPEELDDLFRLAVTI
jgi:chromosome segregation ATPase